MSFLFAENARVRLITVGPKHPSLLEGDQRFESAFLHRRVRKLSVPLGDDASLRCPGEPSPARASTQFAVPPAELGQRHTQITAWLDEDCGADEGYDAIGGTRGC